MDRFRASVIAFLKEHTALEESAIDEVLETPKEQKFGDIAFPCFILAKQLKKAPPQIAQELVEKFQPNEELKEVKQVGPYLNFFVNNAALAGDVLETIFKQKEKYGQGTTKAKVMLEFPSPNTNKPLHLGHVKLIIYGMALSNLLKKTGNTTIVANLLNDRGVHICKSMLAYQKWGSGETPQSSKMKGDYFVGKYYVMFANKLKEHPELEEEAQQLLQKWEDGDKETRALWKQMNTWSRSGMNETFEKFDFNPDKDYLESTIYLDGKKLIQEGFEKDILKKDDNGNIYADLEEYNLSTKVLLRADGTTIYSTQDIALAFHKYTDYKFDKSLYLIGTEQNFYLKQIFKTMEILGFEWGKYCEHVKSGMISLPSGRMKSREGTVVEADGLVEELVSLSRNSLKERYPDLPQEEIEKRAWIIGFGAMRFFFLKYNPASDFVFNPEESIQFDGETGPYVQYTHARICSILRKAEQKVSAQADVALLEQPEEKKIITLLDTYPAVIQEAAKHYAPSKLTRYLLDVCQAYNEFYHKHKVNSDDVALTQARLLLCDCVRSVLKNGLAVLHITAPEEM